MQVLQVNTQDSRGGAAEIVQHLHRSYLNEGMDCSIACGIKYTDDVRSIELDPLAGKNGLTRLLVSAGKQAHKKDFKGAWHLGNLLSAAGQPRKTLDRYRGYEDFHQGGAWGLLGLTGKKPDVLHLHNLHGKGYFDLEALPYLSHQVATFVTMHDAWLLSGHCAHHLDCDKWLTGCGGCPDLDIPPAIARDGSAFNFNRKAQIYQHSLLHVITPSKWLMDQVNRSMLKVAAKTQRVIPNGVDTAIFKPGDRAKARASLGLSQDAFTFLFAADGVKQSFWKDYPTVEHATKVIAAQHRDREIHMIGLGDEGEEIVDGNVRVRFVPYVKQKSEVAAYYQAADLYLHGAKVDTFPNVILEAMACGLPVIATDVGGISEQISDGANGYLCPAGNAYAMAHYAGILMNDPLLLDRFSEHARKTVEQRFTLRQQVKAYLDHYDEVLNDDRFSVCRLSAA